jgi:hypothetical protein
MGSGYRTFTAGEVLTASNVQNYLQDQAVMVFAGTAARSSAIGTANFEEGMLTYLTDVDKLQVYTGATFADVYPAAASTQGLTLINTTSFSAVASQAINSVFSATYENYQIVLKVVGSTGPIGLNLRMRVAGVSASGSDYRFGNHFVTGGGVEGVESSSNSATSASLGSSMYTASYFSNQRIEIFQPFLTERTTGVLQSVHPRDSNGFLNATCYGGFFHNLATSYDGFELLTSTGTMTGNVSVYGYNK